MTRLLQLAALALSGLVLLAFTLPDAIGQQRAALFAHVVSLRGLAAIAALMAAVGFAVLAARARPVRLLGAGLSVLLVAFAVGNAAVVLDRGLETRQVSHLEAGGITVLVWNTLGGAPGAEGIADVVRRTGADVVALPETPAATADEVAGRLGLAAFTVAEGDDPARATSLLVSPRLGEYRIDHSAAQTAVLPTLVAVPVDGTGPTLVAVHTLAPIPPMIEAWQQDLRIVASLCAGGDVVLAGDFNATVDHFAGLNTAPRAHLGECRDAATVTGAAALGTWPTWLPPWLGSPIDHVLAAPGREVLGVWLESGSGSDHRAVVVQLGR